MGEMSIRPCKGRSDSQHALGRTALSGPWMDRPCFPGLRPGLTEPAFQAGKPWVKSFTALPSGAEKRATSILAFRVQGILRHCVDSRAIIVKPHASAARANP